MSIIIVSILLELGVFFWPFLWRFRITTLAVLIPAHAIVIGMLAVSHPNIIGFVGILVIVYRLVNLLRILEKRMHEAYLHRATRRTSLFLSLAQLFILAVIDFGLENSVYIDVILALSTVLTFLLFLSTIRNILKTRAPSSIHHYAERDLPTVSVAIPARNETDDLEACLRSVLASDYPKLEVLVLDDCSQQKTTEIIKGFAQNGVRFIKGKPPADRWLAKNQAYDKLADEASGELLLFCGVDVRFAPNAIRNLVTTSLERRKEMISIMPKNYVGSPLEALIQPLRYWWELALPRRLFNRPAVLSMCWLISRNTLKRLGSFDAVSHSIIPEGYFARELSKKDGYGFLRSNQSLDITTTKDLANQFTTAVRMRYPQVRRRPEMTLGLSLALSLLLLMPFVLAFRGIVNQSSDYRQILSLTTVVFALLTHGVIIAVTNPTNWLISTITFPIAVIIEIFLGNYSMYKYEFSVVEWKGRNICIPVMHTIPRLPLMGK